MGIKNFVLRKMMESKMSQVPKEDREKIFNMIEKEPELFQKIALEMQEEMKNGKSEMDAAMAVMSRHKEELQKLNLN